MPIDDDAPLGRTSGEALPATQETDLGTAPASNGQEASGGWPLDALTILGLVPWHWALPDTFFRLLSSGVAHDAPPLQLNFRELLRPMAPAQRQRLVHQWRRLICGLDDRFDLTLQPDRHRPELRWRIRGAVTLRSAEGYPLAAAGVREVVAEDNVCDIGSRVRAHAFVASRDPMLVVGERWQILEANDAFLELGSRPLSDILGHPLSRYVSANALSGPPATAVSRERSHHHEGMFDAGSGDAIPVELTLSDFTLGDSQQIHYIAVLRDISARKRSERELEHLASIDTLTQLPNRATLQYALNRQLRQISPIHALAVLFIDLDGFKHINDSLGHQAGDTLLRIMVKRLRATLRSRDLIARWGGDEFVVVIDVGSDRQLAPRITRRLLEVLAQPMVIGSHQISVTASIGIVHAPFDGKDSETLLKHADVAMYAAKDKGKNGFAIYHAQLKHHDLEKMSMLSLLRDAIAQETLDFLVQPKFDQHSRIVGAELLARWHGESHVQVPPSIFVPLAEHNGMASALGTLAIEHAARGAARLAASGHPIPVAVNISALHVMDEALPETLRSACRRHAIPTELIELEVTESVFLENTRAPEARIEELRRQGFRVAMDDFGAGYSSLGYLKRLPFDTIKIDRSFLSDLEADPRSRQLLEGIVGLCDLLGMETIAEGVETQAQWQLLQALGIKQYQGFFLGRPMPLEALLERLGTCAEDAGRAPKGRLR